MDVLYPINSIGHAADLVIHNIAEELRERPQWVVWKMERRGDELTKVPYTPTTGQKAKSNDLTTWDAFEEACTALESGSYTGLGFVFCSGDPYCGIDLDNCRDPESGELEGWAAKIVDVFENAYKEISPSGRGVHIITRGKISRSRKRLGLEIYSAERFFTITGRTL
jgi:putative DNA primase/helicase